MLILACGLKPSSFDCAKAVEQLLISVLTINLRCLLGGPWRRRGGRAIKKISRSHLSPARTGWFVQVIHLLDQHHPVCALTRWLRDIFLTAQPPLLV